MSRFKFYVYAYLREFDSVTGNAGTPYYIGKGAGRRAYDIHHNVKVPTNKSNIIFYQTGLSEDEAFELERTYIKLFGRKDLGTGILRNLTEGGDGPRGYQRSRKSIEQMLATRIENTGNMKTCTPESIKKSQDTKIERYGTLNLHKPDTSQKIREARKRHPYKHTPESIRKWRESREANGGYAVSEETAKKISKSKVGYKRSIESRRKQSESRKRKNAEKNNLLK